MSYGQPPQKHDLPPVAIVILNWNGWKDTIECLESLQKLTYPRFRLVVVDNGSSDESVEKIKGWARGEIPVQSRFFEYDAASKPVSVETSDPALAGAGEPMHAFATHSDLAAQAPNRRLVVIEARENLGFSGGNNVGIRYALQSGFLYVLILNNDTVVAEDFLGHLVEMGGGDRETGILGPTIYHYYAPQRVWSAGGRLSLRHRLYSPELRRVGSARGVMGGEADFVTGCALMGKREVFEKIGLLREEYFFGMEDVEFCLRAWRAGFRCRIDPHARIWHKEGGSTQDPLHSPMRVYYVRRNAIHYWRSLQGNPFRLALFFVVLGLRGAWDVSRWLIAGRLDLIVAAWRALRDGLRGEMGRSRKY